MKAEFASKWTLRLESGLVWEFLSGWRWEKRSEVWDGGKAGAGTLVSVMINVGRRGAMVGVSVLRIDPLPGKRFIAPSTIRTITSKPANPQKSHLLQEWLSLVLEWIDWVGEDCSGEPSAVDRSKSTFCSCSSRWTSSWISRRACSNAASRICSSIWSRDCSSASNLAWVSASHCERVPGVCSTWFARVSGASMKSTAVG